MTERPDRPDRPDTAISTPTGRSAPQTPWWSTSQPREACIICRRRGALLYTGLDDWLFGVGGTWRILKCTGCNLLWLDPQPAPDQIPTLYARYYTHTANGPESRLARLRRAAYQHALALAGYPIPKPGRLLARLVAQIPPVAAAAALDVMGVPPNKGGKLLDVGCGNGDFIERMARLGWDVAGVDPDPTAVAYARARGLNAVTGSIECAAVLPGFDIITLNHVIEHVAEPIDLLSQCLRRLTPGTGRLVITTPNICSLGHRWFGKYWRGLEIPRHFFLFSRQALSHTVRMAGLSVETLRTETRLARMIYCPSSRAARGRRNVGELASFATRTKWAAYAFQALEDVIVSLGREAGEELYCVCAAPPTPRDRSTGRPQAPPTSAQRTAEPTAPNPHPPA